MRNLVQATLHSRYHIERELGQGGMGTADVAQNLSDRRLVVAAQGFAAAC